MKALKTMVPAAALAAVLAASAAPVQAAVFAQFSPDTNSMDYRWIRNADPGGHFFSISPTTQSATTAQGTPTHFSFLDPALAALAFIPATFKIDATVSPAIPASINGAGVYTQTNLNGSFSFTYTGATIINYLGSGIDLIHNSNLLSGVFSDAWIQGAGGSGSTNVAIGNGGSATYFSDYELFTNKKPNSEEFAFNLLAVVPSFNATGCPGSPGGACTTALRSFRANGGGNFSFETVPEPATWSLMIAGFGGLGLMLRGNRRRVALASA